MNVNTKAIGERTEGMVLAAFLRAGKVVLQPFGDNQRYDLVVDENGEFVRIQCKTARLRNGCVEFSTCSSYAHRGRKRRGYIGEIEFFAAYCEELDQLYIVPVGDAGAASCFLRVRPTLNRQVTAVRFASDYLFTGQSLSRRPGLDGNTT